MKGYEKSSVHFVQKPCDCFWKKMSNCLWIFFFWRLLLKENVKLIFFMLKTQENSKLNLSQCKYGDPYQSNHFWYVFYRYFDTRYPTNYIVVKPSKFFFIIIERLWNSSQKVCVFLCRNREDSSSYFWIYFVQKPWTTASERKCAADLFYVEANVWLFLETFQCFFLKNVRPLLKRY